MKSERETLSQDFEKLNPEIVLNQDQSKFVQATESLTDQKFETKQISYFGDAFRRFAKNKGSVVAAFVIAFLLSFSIITPFFSGYTATDKEQYFAYALPKNPLFEGTGFWDGTESRNVPIQEYVLYTESGQAVTAHKSDADKSNLDSYYTIRFDSYCKGFVYKTFTETEYNEVVEYDKTAEKGKSVLAPMVDYDAYVDANFEYPADTNVRTKYQNSANITYKINKKGQPVYTYDANGDAMADEDGKIIVQRIFMTDANGDYVYFTLDTGLDGSTKAYNCRINFDNYYIMLHGALPVHVLGSDATGRDIMTRLALAGRLSLLLGIIVSAINFIIGAIYGSIEGYYGGKTDLVMERISEILSEVPSTIIFVLFNWYLKDQIPVIFLLFFAFIFTGWLGTAGTVRMQFYRYKNQEYVLAARTLGAKDSRLIFKHIFPNALGTVVTSSVLMVPGVIFSESSLTYLKIIDLESGGITSIGTMLADGQGSFTVYPNLIIWPALFISLLMICFNVFGNGLRDAFNPTLRGSD